ncbi:MAG: hypothetical protein WCP73_00070 [Eubacteriales bacterium]
MIKRLSAIVIMICLTAVVFAGCSQIPAMASSAENAAPPEVKTSDAATNIAEVSASAPEQPVGATAAADTTFASAENLPKGSIEIKGVLFDQGATTFFNGDPTETIGKLSPLLISAAQAEFSIKKPLYPNENPDVSVQWGMVYQYLNSFGGQAANIKKHEDGSLIVSGDEMTKLFQSLFSFFKGTVPAVQTDFAIAYDQKFNTYTVGRSDFGDILFKVTGFQLSKANSAADPTISATLTVSAYDSDGKSAGNILVEIVPKAGTYYGYSVQSIEIK